MKIYQGRVIAGQHSNPSSLHYPEREVCAARLHVALLSNARDTQFPRPDILWRLRNWSGRTLRGPYPRSPMSTSSWPELGLQAIATPPICRQRSKPCTLYFLLRNSTNHMGLSSRNPLLSSQIASKISILEAERNRMPSLTFDYPLTQYRQHCHQCVTVSVELNHLYMEETGCRPTAIKIVHRRGYGTVSPHPHLWTCGILRSMRHKNFSSIWPMCMCEQIIHLHDFDRMCIYQHGQTCIEVFHHKNQWQWLGITLEEDVLEVWITLKPGSVLSTV